MHSEKWRVIKVTFIAVLLSILGVSIFMFIPKTIESDYDHCLSTFQRTQKNLKKLPPQVRIFKSNSEMRKALKEYRYGAAPFIRDGEQFILYLSFLGEGYDFPTIKRQFDEIIITVECEDFDIKRDEKDGEFTLSQFALIIDKQKLEGVEKITIKCDYNSY